MNQGSYLKTYALGIPESLAILAMIAVAAVILWAVRNWKTPFNDHRELRQGNTALAIERGAFIAGALIAMTAAVKGYDPNHVAQSLLVIGVKNLFVIAAMLGLGRLVDWAILPDVQNDELLLKKNHAVAIAMAGAYLGLGCVLGAALTGTASTLFHTIASTIFFAAAGMAVVLGVIRTHVWLAKRTFGYDLHAEFEKGTIIPAIELGALALSVAMIVAVGVSGDLHGWWDGIKAFSATATIALGMLYGTQWAINRLLVHRSTREVICQENLALITVLGVGRIAFAFVLATIVAYVL